MERLTTPGYRYYDDEFMDSGVAKYMNRLSAYENTGLKPERIEKLIELFTDDKVVELARILRKAFECGEVGHIRDLIQAEQDERDAQELYCLALNTWGGVAQTWMVFEEMSELQKELGKHARGKDNLEAIADEIADVFIMLEQMMILHDCGQAVKEHKAAKLKRLESRLNSVGVSLAGKDSAAPDAPEDPAGPEWKSRVMRTFLGGR